MLRLASLDTTRSPRPGEVDGREYHFVDRHEFEALRDRNAFLEWAEFSKNLYGTSIESVQKVLDSGKMCILDIDLQGVHSVKRVGAHLNPRYVFIKPPNFEELKTRLIARATESPESLAMRLQTAEHEMRFAEEHPDFHDCIIVNDDLETAYRQLDEFIFGGSVECSRPQNNQ